MNVSAKSESLMKKSLLEIAAVTMLLVTSCSTPKNIAYFPELQTGDIVTTEQIQEIKVKPEDKLSIIVTTPSPAISLQFNLLTISNRLTGTTESTKTIGTTNSSNGQTSYYTVNSNGDIDFPIIGKLHIAGMSREEIASYIAKQLIDKNLVTDPIVTVEFANTGISIIGEVRSPGRYEFNKDHLSIIDAIAMAGDLTMNGMRENILVMRNIGDGKQQAYRINLLNAQELASSPVFYLQQDDVIYVEPNNKAKRETTPNGNTPYTPSFWVSMGSFAVTIITLIITLTR